MKANCTYCGKEFNRTPSLIMRTINVFCSHKCHGMWMGGSATITCSYCGKEIKKKSSVIKRCVNNFCSRKCQGLWNSKNLCGENHNRYSKVKVNCTWCGKEKEVAPWKTKKNSHHFCNRVCQGKWLSKNHHGNKHNIGKKLSKETKAKISKSHIGITPSLETLKKMSAARKGKIGENSANWRGGITPKNQRIRTSIEYHLWREAVFARDNWTCQKCEERGVELNAHHIKPFAKYPELRVAIDNGITYCKKCHRKSHRKPKNESA